jgi:hypothetical protein
MRLVKACAAACVLALGPATSIGFPAPTPASAATLFVDYVKPAPGPRGPITVIGDSVMLGSVLETDGYGPSVAQMLVDRGWGPVRAKAGVGFQAGLNLPNLPGANMSRWVTDIRALGWDSPVYVISIGPNDIVGCNSNLACAEKDIELLVDTIGADHEVWWAMITMPDQHDADVWNEALTAVADARPNLHVWDWPAARVQAAIPLAGDGYHLPTGAAYVARSRLIADDVTARLGVSNHVGGGETPPDAIGATSEYQPLPLDRVFDSRTGPARVVGGTSIEIDLAGKVPEAATAVSVNLTAVGPAHAGFLTAYPCGGALPVTSNVNYEGGQTRPNHVVVGLSGDRRLCVFASATGDVVVDLQGAFVPSGGLELNTQAPSRLVDTRNTGRADPLQVPMPAGVKGVVLNVTAVNAIAPGFLVVYPCDASPIPSTSNLNFVAGDAVAGSVYAEVSKDGKVCAHSNVPVDVVVDLQGTFTEGGALRFQAAVPKRMLDTRIGTGGWRGQVGSGQTIDLAVAPPGAQAVTGNLTMVQPGLDGFATAFGCSLPTPETSSVNASRRLIAANSLTTGSGQSLCVRPSVSTHVIFDTTGWWIA